jgi:hypothetical protein
VTDRQPAPNLPQNWKLGLPAAGLERFLKAKAAQFAKFLKVFRKMAD